MSYGISGDDCTSCLPTIIKVVRNDRVHHPIAAPIIIDKQIVISRHSYRLELRGPQALDCGYHNEAGSDEKVINIE